MKIIYKIKFKIPKKRSLKKKLTHNEAVQIINNSEQMLGNLQEQFKLHIFPFINTEIFNENNNEIIRIINNPDKIINDLITQALYLENKIDICCI